MSSRQTIRTGQSCASDAREAVREFHSAVAQQDMALVIFFCSPSYDLEALAGEMRRLFGSVRVIGCTTAGEFGPGGYRNHSLSGASFPAADFVTTTGVLGQLQEFEMARGHAFGQGLVRRMESLIPDVQPSQCFAFLLVDGMSVREEPVTRAVQHGIGRIPLFGGSAGDGLQFSMTQVFHDGRFQTDAAVVALVHTRLPFRIFKTQHFVATDERMVVTEADADLRIVREINGMPAAAEYARLVGVDVHDLDPMRFAASPVVVLIDGMEYVRSIQKANADGSLTFYCAIEEGLVLRVARGVDMVENLEQTLANVRREIGAPQAVIGCDCILRKLEMGQSDLTPRIERTLRDCNAVGFNTYGEQYAGVHVNQTFTGIAIAQAEVPAGARPARENAGG